MVDGLRMLLARLDAATGSDRALDAEIGRLLGPRAPEAVLDYTASVDRTIDLVHALLPDWGWHLGWNATGVLPYAVLHAGVRRVEAAAPTVPLALLKAMVRALAANATGNGLAASGG